MLLSPPDGEHRLWDVADRDAVGVVPGGQLGIGLATGDLDGDGAPELLASAPIAAPGLVSVARGPCAGDRAADAVEWTVSAADGQWAGYDLGVGDFDGDGAPDLALGAPEAGVSGAVYVFLGPPPGAYTVDQASLTLSTGTGADDDFGISLAIGDLDGDGRSDLVVGAPDDPTGAWMAGSATIFYAATL